jgi:hypothetical protein
VRRWPMLACPDADDIDVLLIRPLRLLPLVNARCARGGPVPVGSVLHRPMVRLRRPDTERRRLRGSSSGRSLERGGSDVRGAWLAQRPDPVPTVSHTRGTPPRTLSYCVIKRGVGGGQSVAFVSSGVSVAGVASCTTRRGRDSTGEVVALRSV